MKLKRILATLVVLAMALSLVPMAFAATAGIDIDFTSTDFDGWASTLNRTSKQSVTGKYGKANDDTSMSIVSTTTALATTTAGRLSQSNVALSKSGSRLSFKIAAADTRSRKGVTFNSSTAVPATAILFEMKTDGKMYVLGDEICAYETERWYQIDIEFASTGAYTVYVDGGHTAKVSDTSSADMSGIFGSTTNDVENRYLICFMTDKANNTPASTLYVDDFETETTDAASAAAVPDTRKIEIQNNTGATLENGVMSNLPDGATVDSILAGFSITNGDVTVLDNAGSPVTTGDLAPGMKLVIASEDGSTKVEYTIDCLNLVFTAPSGTSTRALTQDISATFTGTGSVEFWVNGEKKVTDTEAPYEYTVEHTAGGDYSVYAVVITAGDVRTQSETKTYTFVANSVPTVSATNPSGNAGANAGVGRTDTIKLNVTATDSDYADSGVTKVELYFDGAKVAENTASAPNTQTLTLAADYTVSNLSVGSHSYYAKAYDADGAAATSDTVEFSVIETSATDIDNATFENGGVSIMGEYLPNNKEPQLSVMNDPTGSGKGMVMGYSNGTLDGMYMKNDSGTFSGIETLYWEMDIYTNDTSANSYVEVRSPNAGSGEPTTNISISEMGIQANQWYRIKYVVNVSTSIQEMYISSDNGSTWSNVYSGATDAAMNGSIASTRVYINAGKAANYEFYMDNIRMYKVQESTYVTATNYVNEAGVSVVVSDGVVGVKLDKIQLVFNNPVERYFIDETNFAITDEDGNTVTGFAVSTSLTTVTIDLAAPLKSRTAYTVAISGLDERIAGGVPSSLTFTTDAAPYDVTSAVVNTDGTGATMTVKNTTGAPVSTTVIYAVYSGDKLIGLSYKSELVPVGGGTVIADPITTWIGTDEGNVTAKVFFWSDLLGATRTVQTAVVE